MSQTILLADDSVTIQKVIELTFMDEDYEVVSAGNGDEALDRLEEVSPDVVIADVHMPGASGFDVAKRSKQLHPAVPVLLLVGTFEPFDETDFEASGADSYLKKPFDSQELLQRVNDLLEAAPEGAAEPPLGTATAPLDSPPPPPPADEDDEDISDLGTRAVPELGGGRDEAVQPASTPPPAPAAADEGATEPFPELDRPAAAAGDDDIFRGFAEADGSSEVRPPLEDAEEAEVELAAEPEAEAPELELEEEEPGWELEPDAASEPAFELEPEPEPEPVEEPEAEPEEEAAPSGVPTPAAPATAAEAGRDGELSDAEVDRIARRVVELMGGDALREVAWEVVPDLAEVVIKERLKELEEQVESG